MILAALHRILAKLILFVRSFFEQIISALRTLVFIMSFLVLNKVS